MKDILKSVAHTEQSKSKQFTQARPLHYQKIMKKTQSQNTYSIPKQF